MTEQEVRQLKEQLTSTRAEARKKAFAELKKLGTDQALGILTTSLDAKNSDVQADLMKAILAFKDEALPFLVKAFNDPLWRVRKTAAEIIGSMGDRALGKFLALIPQNEEDVDFWMVQVLGFMGGEATPYLTRAFHHPNPRIRLAAVRAAANTGDPHILPSLIGMLSDPSWAIRKAAFDTLSRVQHLNPEAVIEAVKRADQEAKYWLIRLAGERQDPRLIPVFCGIIEHDNEDAKLEAIRALAEIQRPEAHKVLIGYLSHRSWIVRKTAAEAIWEQGYGISDELLSASAASNTDSRFWSVKILGRMNEPTAFPKLLERLQDPDPSVRSAACQALGSLGNRQALAPLMTLLADPSEEVRTSAVLAMSQIGEKDEKQGHRPSMPSMPSHLRPENQQTCTQCGKKVSRDFSYCPFCLSSLGTTCRKCGRTLQSDWKGCPDCGQRQ